VSESHDQTIQRLVRRNILLWAMEPGGVDAWARIDRRIPGELGWVIVPQQHGSYEPGAMAVTDSTIVKALERLQGGSTLEDLACTAEFIDQADAILGDGAAQDYEPSVAAGIVQIGLFGSVWYP
jgi:hypothetical protein